MKAIVMLSRVGQVVILAIAFMACVGWNQAAGLQNNIASLTRKRVKDIVRIRYVLPHTNLHSVPTPCDNSNIAFETQGAANNLNNQITWTEAQSCKVISSQSSFLKPITTDKAIFGTEKISSLTTHSSCQNSQSITSLLQGQGYFSGFENSSAQADFADDISLVSTDRNKTYAVPVYVAFGNAGCTVTACHNKGDAYTTVATTRLPLMDGNSIDDDEYSVIYGISRSSVTVGCLTK